MDSKGILKSITAWGGIVMILPAVLKLFGIDVTPAEVQSGWDTLMAMVNNGAEFVGFVMVIYGRWKAGGIRLFGFLKRA